MVIEVPKLRRRRMLSMSSGIVRCECPTPCLIQHDEADRLRMAGLEQVRNIFDHGGIGLVLIGMPGIEKRLARYPQFYSRIGFVHEFRTLGNAEIRQLMGQCWTPPGVKLPERPLDQAPGA